jgi:hypothetical protein
VLNVVETDGLLLYGRTIQVRSKEMNEMRMNHRRGVVTNLVVAQNPRVRAPTGQVISDTCIAAYDG